MQFHRNKIEDVLYNNNNNDVLKIKQCFFPSILSCNSLSYGLNSQVSPNPITINLLQNMTSYIID